MEILTSILMAVSDLLLVAACISTVVIALMQSRKPAGQGNSAAKIAGLIPIAANLLFHLFIFISMLRIYGSGIGISVNVFWGETSFVLGSLVNLITSTIPLLFLLLISIGKKHVPVKMLVLLIPFITTFRYPWAAAHDLWLSIAETVFMSIPLILYYAVIILAIVWYCTRSAALSRVVFIAGLAVLLFNFLLTPWFASTAGIGAIINPFRFYFQYYFGDITYWNNWAYRLFPNYHYPVLAMIAAAGLLHKHLPMGKPAPAHYRAAAPVQQGNPYAAPAGNPYAAPAQGPYAQPVNNPAPANGPYASPYIPPVQNAPQPAPAPIPEAPTPAAPKSPAEEILIPVRMEDEEILFCEHCGKELPEDAAFCIYCGRPVIKTVICSKCGASLPEDSVFCKKCGAPVNPPVDYAK